MTSNANAQVSWIYWQYEPSIGSNTQDFLNWLNKERSARGLSILSYDISLEKECHKNNLLQYQYGIGHHFMERSIRQNASGIPDFGRVGPCWMKSPAHYAGLMDPNIRWFAITYYAGYTTFSAY